jgi:hypothetical protein
LEYQRVVPKQPFAFHSDSWTGPPQATAGPYALPKCRTYACSATTCPYSWLPLQHVFLHVESSNQKKQIRVVGGMSTPQADWLLGLPLTQNSRHVVSTFKCLTPITTHRDLNQSINTDGVSFPSMILHITPSVILIVTTEL